MLLRIGELTLHNCDLPRVVSIETAVALRAYITRPFRISSEREFPAAFLTACVDICRMFEHGETAAICRAALADGPQEPPALTIVKAGAR